MVDFFRGLLRRKLPVVGSTRSIGDRGESLAARHLRKKRYKVLHRNYVVSLGEADIVCLAPDGKTIVFVEVKTKILDEGQASRRAPEANVHHHKQRKLAQVAEVIARQEGWMDRPWRIDVIGVDLRANGGAELRHHENAVQG